MTVDREGEGEVNRVLILGIDAVEYDLVERWSLDNLKQEEYGRSRLPIEPEDGYLYGDPVTPIMWTSFIAGRPPKDHGVDTVKIYPLNSLYRWYLRHVGRQAGGDHFTPVEEHKSTKRKMLDAVSDAIASLHLSREPGRKDIQSDTLFDDSWANHLHIPVYDDNAFPSYKKKIVKAIEEKAYRPIFEMACKEEFQQRSNEVMEWLDRRNDWRLLMQYFYVLDGVQHAFFYSDKKIARFYLMFDEFVGNLRRRLDDDTLLLIVSDHGQNRGVHTDHGFFSVNRQLGLDQPRFVDFRWIVEDILGE